MSAASVKYLMSAMTGGILKGRNDAKLVRAYAALGRSRQNLVASIYCVFGLSEVRALPLGIAVGT